VQLAKQRGARVTAVCGPRNIELVRSLGADRVIDYTAEDFTKNGETYDAILDCVGNAPFDKVADSIKPGGALLLVITNLRSMLRASRDSRKSGKLVTTSGAPVSHDQFAELSRLADAGALRPVIDRTYDLDDIVEAHRYVDTGHKTGSVVLRIA
jgi:NADPH:quinone reductase-like Zn-dependent oxidoreductase